MYLCQEHLEFKVQFFTVNSQKSLSDPFKLRPLDVNLTKEGDEELKATRICSPRDEET